MDPKTFQKKVLQRAKAKSKTDRDPPLVALVRQILERYKHLWQDPGRVHQDLKEIIKEEIQKTEAAEIPLSQALAQADDDYLAYQALTEVAAEKLAQGEPLPPPLNHFAAEVLAGRRKPPRPRGPYPCSNIPRDEILAHLVAELAFYHGCYIYRNEADEKDLKHCALDIVAEAAGLGYEALRKIWQRSQARKILRALKNPTD
ncbi:MAG: hypothetical protein JRI66_13300 [Deltaproteobacteria bacterium]|nr:hypothetical protein [Deltaproteobacteria bacterium]